MKFKVGDRVKCIGYPIFNELGKVGTIIGFRDYDMAVVEFDEAVGGHNGSGQGSRVRGKNGHCVWEWTRHLELVTDEKPIVKIENNKCPTQCERIREYLKTHNEITQLEALTELGIMRLASRISEMKKRGEPIGSDTKTVENRWGEKCKVSRYFYEK